MTLFTATTVEETERLIASGADINYLQNGITPLKNACKNGNLNIVKVLCKAGADIDAHCDRGRYSSIGVCCYHRGPAGISAGEGYLEIVKFFVNNYSPNLTALLAIASRYGHTDILDYLLTLAVNLVDTDCNPLFWACFYNQIDAVDRLLIAGANPNIIGYPFKITPIMQAASNGRLDIVKKLMVYGADFNCEYDDTTILISTRKNYTDISKFLIQLGCNINCCNYFMITPLMYSCKNNNLEIIKLLLDNKADVDFIDKTDKKAIDYCTSDECRALFID